MARRSSSVCSPHDSGADLLAQVLRYGFHEGEVVELTIVTPRTVRIEHLYDESAGILHQPMASVVSIDNPMASFKGNYDCNRLRRTSREDEGEQGPGTRS